MLRVLICIGQDHDLRLVLVAAVICASASALAFWLYRKGLDRRSRGGWGWFAFGGAAAGYGIWATHFVAMLAFEPALKTGYHLGGTLLSLLFGVVAAGSGFAVAAHLKGRIGAVCGGVVLGVGIGLMHFTGMASFQTQGVLIWDQGYVAASLGLGVILAIAALLVAGDQPDLKRGGWGAVVLVIAICALHFTAMAAVTILPDPTKHIPAALAERGLMAGAIAGLAVLVMAGALVATVLEARNRHSALVKLRLATDAMPAALAVYDADDRLMVWNARYERIVPGGGKVLRQGMTFDELLSHYRIDATAVAEEKVRRRAGVSSVQQFAKDLWIRIENMPTADGGVVTVGVDVSSLKRDQEALQHALQQAEAGSRAKSEFLANMSHEIRTPLNGVAGVADILAGTTLDERQAGLVEVIRNSARQVDSLLGDILDLSSLEAGRTKVERLPFTLAATIRDAAFPHAAIAESKGIELVVDLPQTMETTVEGDAIRLSQILNSLISNAVKFTERGQVTVDGRELDGDRFLIRVRDTGPGFDPAAKELLFERFTQSDSSATRRHGGAGMGLALARRSAQLLGAVLDCDSTPGEGTVFTLEAPLPRTSGSQPEGAVAPRSMLAAGRPLTALIVDDNPTNRQILELILDQVGASHVSVENGREAVDAHALGAFDVILMDIQMPVMDGIEATREIRRAEAQNGRPQTPVIIISANCLPEQVLAGQEAGAQRHMPKPVNAGVLIEALGDVLDSRARQAA